MGAASENVLSDTLTSMRPAVPAAAASSMAGLVPLNTTEAPGSMDGTRGLNVHVPDGSFTITWAGRVPAPVVISTRMGGKGAGRSAATLATVRVTGR